MGDQSDMESTVRQQVASEHGAVPKILDYVDTCDMLRVNNLLRDEPDQVNAVSPAHHWTPLHVAVMRNDKRMVDILLRHGANVNAQNLEGRTPLHDAAGRGESALVELLLEHGADKSLLYKGKTALQRAQDRGHDEVVDLLK
jgi:ankyrin repeat protein